MAKEQPVSKITSNAWGRERRWADLRAATKSGSKGRALRLNGAINREVGGAEESRRVGRPSGATEGTLEVTPGVTLVFRKP
jgi:hypothetical protein